MAKPQKYSGQVSWRFAARIDRLFCQVLRLAAQKIRVWLEGEMRVELAGGISEVWGEERGRQSMTNLDSRDIRKYLQVFKV